MLAEKINYEFQCFFLELTRTSRENIFAHSAEIEIKKRLREELISLAETIDEPKRESLLVQSNLLESAYVFVTEQGLGGGEMEQEKKAADQDHLSKWLTYVLGESPRAARPALS